MCVHRQHRTGNCPVCTPALAESRVPEMPQLWSDDGDDS